ncbi:phenylalanine--tRNA ligase subunit beta [Thermocladium modestius]|uniref:phenylalanine--tRNA ligase subunit beta n=1 Tax=Thermocladium modestius TaxID=62609 RepID=UPI0016658263|nr:phenylalanine--tRNA ligase subunit beta [Thermocladium modestius]
MSVSVNLRDLEELMGRKLSIDDLRELIKFVKAEIEEARDEEVELEVTHDRPDHFSAEGLSRTLKGVLGIETGLTELEFKWSDGAAIHEVPNRRYAVFAIVHGLFLNDEALKQLIQLQEKLSTVYGRNRRRASIGIYDLAKVELPIEYKQVDLDKVNYVPLDSKEAIRGAQLLETEKGKMYGEYALMNGKVPVIMDSDGNVLAVAPVLGSEITKVDTGTRDVLMDVTAIDPKSLREVFTIFIYGLRERTRNRRVEIIGTNALTPADLSIRKWRLSLNFVNDLLGTELDQASVASALLRARHGVNSLDGGEVEVSVAPYRLSVIHPVDLVEDVAILHGYHNMEGVYPPSPSGGKLHPLTRLSSLVREAMVGLGAQEVLNYALTDPFLASLDGTPVKILNPISELYSMVRTGIWPQLISTLVRNKTLTARKPKVFEVGRVAFVAGDSVVEENHLGFAVTGDEVTLTDVLVILNSLLYQLNVKPNYSSMQDRNGINGRTVRVMVDGIPVGKAFEVNPDILIKLGLENPAGAFEVNLDELAKIILAQ